MFMGIFRENTSNSWYKSSEKIENSYLVIERTNKSYNI